MAEDGNRGTPTAQRIAGRYEVLGRLGSGPHGPTYRARDHRRLEASEVEREVALKILRPAGETAEGAAGALDQGLRALREELARLDEPTLVGLRDTGRTELGLPYACQELMRGESLEERLLARGPFPLAEARALARRIAASLERAHAAGLVHGALDAHHVLLVEDDGAAPEPRILDLGLAAVLSPGEPTERDDVRGVGRLLAAMLSGDPSGTTLPALVDVEIVRIIEDALDELGFQEMRALRAALEDPPPLPHPVDPGRRGVLVRPGPSRRPLALAALVFAALAALASWLARGRVEARGAEQERALAAESERLRTELARREERERELEQALEAARAGSEERASDAQRGHLAAQLDSLGRALEEARGETERVRAQLSAELESQAERADALAAAEREAAAALERERRRLEELSAEHREAQATVRALEAREAERQRERALEDALVDGLSACLRDGRPRALWSLLRGLEEDGRIEPGLAQEPWLDLWTEAADRVRRLAAAGPAAEAQDERAARAALEEASAAREGFAVALRTRFGRREPLEESLTAAVEGLARALDDAALARAAERAAAWRAVLEDPLASEPRHALALSSHEPGGTVALARSLADELVARYAPPRAPLDREALAAGPALGPWLEALGAGDDAPPGLGELARFAWAQAWFAPGPRAAPGEEPFARWPLPAPDPEPWSGALAAEVGLLHPRGPWPGAAGRRFLYRSRAADGEESWQVETVLPPEETTDEPGRRWRVEQRFYDAEGRLCGERSLALERRGRRLLEHGVQTRVVFEAAGEPRPEGSWSPPPAEPPERLSFSAEALGAFRERLAAAPPRTVAVGEGDGAGSLWTAELGLVRYEDPARVVRELCYAD